MRATVLIGSYNNGATLGRAIESVLAQTVPVECLVVDDGSSDDTVAIAEGYGARVLSMGTNVGIARSLNAGLRAASADAVAVNDADDWSEPTRIERELAVLDAHTDVAVVGCRMREVDPAGRELRPRTSFAPGDVGDALLRFNPIPNTSALMRRDPILAVGGYDPRYRYAMEYDLWLRLVEAGWRAWTLDEVLATRTMSGVNVAARAERAQIAEVVRMRVAAQWRRRELRGVTGVAPYALSWATPLPLKRALRRRLGQAE